MSTLICILLALAIQFLVPSVSAPNRSNIINQKYLIQFGFPYQYYSDEILTDEEIHYRIRVIYISLMFTWLGTFSCAPIVGQVLVPFVTPSVPLEVLIQNQKDADYKSTVLTAPVVKAATAKVQLTSEQIDLVYQLAMKYRNNYLSTKDLIAELRGGNHHGFE